jgi:hypothetical protein
MSIEHEVRTDDNKTSRLEIILKQGKTLLYTTWGAWLGLEAWGLIGVESVKILYPWHEISGEPALDVANSLFPVLTAWTGAFIAVIVGKADK